MADSPMKVDERTERNAGYKSWKKKYRKMRITFDQKMHDGEELHKKEAKASATVKRLAIENDRLLDMLLEINNSPQIPHDKRIDLSLPKSKSNRLALPLDSEDAPQKQLALKRLEQLLNDVPHSSYSTTKESQPSIIADLTPVDGEIHPATFLSADDVDNYLFAIDNRLEIEQPLPTLAPNAHPSNSLASNPQLKNPTSVTNWLRKHAPKIFLQDGETHGDGDDGDGHGKKPRGGRADRGGRASTRGKRASTSARHAVDKGDIDASMDDDPEFGATPVAKGKRKRDDDGGYKPRGSSSRPTKKKRKSDAEGTPSVRKSNNEAAAASKED